MSNLNSSGSRERFTLASGENKAWTNDVLGSNFAQCEIQGDDQAVASVSVKLQTSEDGVSYSDVGSAVTVVPRGTAYLNGAVGKFHRVISTSGNDIVHVVVHHRNRAEITPSL